MNSAQHRIIAAGVIGNVLEWYDFAIYGYFAAAIGRQFFPHEDLNSFSMAMMVPTVILAGLLSDRFGRKPLLLFSTLLGIVGALPLFWLLHHPSIAFAQFGQLGFVLIIGVYLGVLPAAVVEAAPPGEADKELSPTKSVAFAHLIASHPYLQQDCCMSSASP